MGQRGLLSAVFGKETRSFLHPAPPTIATISTKSRFHGAPRKARFQRNQRNHDSTAPQRNHESNETHEKNETPGKKAFRCFRCIWINRDFVGNVGANSPLSLASLASSPEVGAKCTAVKPGKRVVRQSRREVRLTTAWPTPTGVLLPPPVGEVAQAAQADCDGEGNRQAQRKLRGLLTYNGTKRKDGRRAPPDGQEPAALFGLVRRGALF